MHPVLIIGGVKLAKMAYEKWSGGGSPGCTICSRATTKACLTCKADLCEPCIHENMEVIARNTVLFTCPCCGNSKKFSG